MPTFATPEPISVSVELSLGEVRFVASDRADTVVELRPANDADPEDVSAVERTRVDFTDGALSIRTLQRWRSIGFSRHGGSVDVLVELPTGSQVSAELAMGHVHGTGTLGSSRVKTSTGNIRLDGIEGALRASTSLGDIRVERCTGEVDATTASGEVRLHTVGGSAKVQNSNGHTWVGEAAGPLRVTSANGDITVDAAAGDVSAKTAMGAVRLGQVVTGEVSMETSAGDLAVGVREGTAAWLDAKSSVGAVHNALRTVDGAGDATETVRIRARTWFGEINVVRA